MNGGTTKFCFFSSNKTATNWDIPWRFSQSQSRFADFHWKKPMTSINQEHKYEQVLSNNLQNTIPAYNSSPWPRLGYYAMHWKSSGNGPSCGPSSGLLVRRNDCRWLVIGFFLFVYRLIHPRLQLRNEYLYFFIKL